jgi:UDP-N-acetylglucosamine:LPS N-acetylglucosamine transferase
VGTVRLVVDGGGGWWTPSPELVVDQLRALREDRRHELDNAAIAARKLAAPGAARLVAAEIIALLAERVTA